MKVAVIFENFGPYHLARLSAVAKMVDLLGIEVASRSAVYDWKPAVGDVDFQRAMLIAEGTSAGASRRVRALRLNDVLCRFRPEIVAIPGWCSLEAILAVRWCIENLVPVVVMSESQAIDDERTRLKEGIKARFLHLCSAALVGGQSHRAYLVQLGMAVDRIFFGYDAVDNEYFTKSANAARGNADETRRKLNLPQHYFLASSRFVPKKNLFTLLRAYARYRSACGVASWDLVLLGDGPLRSKIESLRRSLGLVEHLHLPGFRQYAELPAYYGLAEAFIHASTTEPWGLVVNEAMASGLPVIVSNRCGCHCELVEEGKNGFLFDPLDEGALADCLVQVADDGARRATMGEESRGRIQAWGPDRFARGLQEAAELALRIGAKDQHWLDRLMLRILAAR